jgi:hypothetical protein
MKHRQLIVSQWKIRKRRLQGVRSTSTAPTLALGTASVFSNNVCGSGCTQKVGVDKGCATLEEPRT